MKVSFSINQYDEDGDAFDQCLLLHFGETSIIRLASVQELKEVIENLNKIVKEIEN